MNSGGAQAEDQALRFLLQQGLKLKQRNYACRFGETRSCLGRIVSLKGGIELFLGGKEILTGGSESLVGASHSLVGMRGDSDCGMQKPAKSAESCCPVFTLKA